MIAILLVALGIAVAAAVFLIPIPASAHCDTMDGPVVQAGERALRSGNVNHALPWVPDDAEAEVRKAFAELPELGFLTELVRIHRAGEGAGFDGLKESGAPIDEKVAAADRCIEVGSLEPLAGLVAAERMPEVERRFADVLALKDYDVDDVPAGRAYIAAYVRFFKFIEGEHHDRDHRGLVGAHHH